MEALNRGGRNGVASRRMNHEAANPASSQITPLIVVYSVPALRSARGPI